MSPRQAGGKKKGEASNVGPGVAGGRVARGGKTAAPGKRVRQAAAGPGAAPARSHGPRSTDRGPDRRTAPASAPRPRAEAPAADAPLAWTREGRLFPAPGPEAASLLADYELVLGRVLPLRASHARDLPSAIQSLSASLTSERGAGPKPGYLSDPRTLSAYAWYFLPWNLYRLTRLARGLALDLAEGAVVVDAGAGPLTFVQALWIAAPHLRERPLTFVCLDRSRAALALGRELFLALAGEDAPWRVETVREELPRLPRGAADLLVAANVLNELAARRSTSLSEKTARLAESLTAGLAPGGRLLVVEPGVRASGKLLGRLREHLLTEEGLAVAAPCPHAGPCPLAARGSGAWCHFTVDAAGVPDWLETLSRRAGLPKRDVSLSFLFVAGQTGRADPALGRVVSNPFPIPGMEGAFARYACAAGGLRLYVTPGRGGLVPGDLARTARPAHPVRDRKSGAVIYVLAAAPAGDDPARGKAGDAGPRQKGTRRRDAASSERPGTEAAGSKKNAAGPAMTKKAGREKPRRHTAGVSKTASDGPVPSKAAKGAREKPGERTRRNKDHTRDRI